MPDQLIDLPSSGTVATQVGPSRVSYPFLNAPIPTATPRLIARDFAQLATSYVPAIASPPPTDYALHGAYDSAADATAYLVEESEAAPTGIAGLVRFTRTCARIPDTQYFPSSRTFARPDLHDIKSGSHYGVSFDKRRAWIFSSRKTISATAAITASSVKRTGTVTRTGTNPGTKQAFSPDSLPVALVTYQMTNGSSGSFHTSNLASAIKANLQVSGWTGNVTSSGGALLIETYGSTVKFAWLQCADSSIVVSGSSSSYTFTRKQTSSYADVTEVISETDSQNITETHSVDGSVREFTTSAAHNGQVGDYVALYKGDRVVAMSVVRSLPTTAKFTVPLADVDGKDFTADTCVFSSAALWCIAIEPPVTGASARRVQRFYLPGVTTGITNAADIPLFSAETDAITWLAKVVAYLTTPSEDTYFITDSGDVQQWRGPILMKEVTEVQMQDVAIQVSATA